MSLAQKVKPHQQVNMLPQRYLTCFVAGAAVVHADGIALGMQHHDLPEYFHMHWQEFQPTWCAGVGNSWHGHVQRGILHFLHRYDLFESSNSV